MSNIVINPSSGILEFNTGVAQGNSFDNSLLGASRLEFKNSGELSLTSLGTGVPEKFTIDGSNGRLFTVDNIVTGSIFSINDAAGLPIVEVFSDDIVVMGQFASDALVVSGTAVGIGTTNPARKLHVSDAMRLEPTTTPASPSAGDIYFDSSTNKLRCYDGTAWQDCF